VVENLISNIYIYKVKTMSKEMRKYIDDFKSFVLNEDEMNIIEKEQMTQEQKVKELDKIVAKYGIFTNNGPLSTFSDYLEYKKENPNYPELEKELNRKAKEINYIHIEERKPISIRERKPISIRERENPFDDLFN